jgi:hypothetical protein
MSSTPFLIVGVVQTVLTALVALDAAQRNRSWVAWAALTALTGPIGLIVWLLARRRSPVANSLDTRRRIRVSAGAILILLLSVIVRT